LLVWEAGERLGRARVKSQCLFSVSRSIRLDPFDSAQGKTFARHDKLSPRHWCLNGSERFRSSIPKLVSDSRQISYMSESAGQVDIAAKFFRIAFVHEDSAVMQHRTSARMFDDLARRAIVVSSIVDCIKRIRSRWKVQRRHLRFRKKVDVVRSVARRSLRRHAKMLIGAS
jgi:hypothetical protein